MIEASQKLTKEFLMSNRVVFEPKTPEEALLIQKQLKGLGIGWVRDYSVGAFLDECVSQRMVVEDGQLYYNPTGGTYVVRRAQDFSGFDARDLISPQEKLMLEQFNALSAKVDHLTALLEKVVEKIDPPPLDKPLPPPLGPKKP